MLSHPDDFATTAGAASAYLAAGLSVIPVKSDGSKAPLLRGWREYAGRPPTRAELHAWFHGRTGRGVGVVCGPASGNLAVLDFERMDPALRWWSKLERWQRRILRGCPQVRTPGGGVHFYLRLREPERGCKLARTAAGECLIEVRGAGHFVVAPGSPPQVHPTGRPYLFARLGWLGGGADPAPIADDVYHQLTYHATCLNEYRRPAARETVGDRPVREHGPGDRPGDRFNRRASWADILGPFGWRPFKDSGDGITYWTRPGKAAGISASTGFCRGETAGSLLYVFSTSAPPFEAEKSYSKFAAYALLSHRGDYAAAARALGLAGYAAPRAKGGVR